MGARVPAAIVAASAIAWCAAGVAGADPDTPADPTGTDHGAANAAAPPAPGPAGAVPQTLIDHDGTFTVGKDIVAGVYTSAGPLPGDACYWRRIGADNATVENALSKQPQTVLIDPADAAFKTKGCQPWQLSQDAAPPNQNPPWLSQLQLRHNLDILNGLAGQSGNGQLPPY